MHRTHTHTQFNSLSNPDKYSILEDRSIYLGVHRLAPPYKIALFEYSSYYVEVWLNQVSDELRKAEAFDNYERLDPFLRSIDVSSLYSLLG